LSYETAGVSHLYDWRGRRVYRAAWREWFTEDHDDNVIEWDKWNCNNYPSLIKRERYQQPTHVADV